MSIDFDNPRTVDGRPVRILCTDAPGVFPIIGLVKSVWSPQAWNDYGVAFSGVTCWNLAQKTAPVLDAAAREAARLAWRRGVPSSDGALVSFDFDEAQGRLMEQRW